MRNAIRRPLKTSVTAVDAATVPLGQNCQFALPGAPYAPGVVENSSVAVVADGHLTVTVNGANDTPVAVVDAGTAVVAGTAAGSNATGNVLSNDTDVDTTANGDGQVGVDLQARDGFVDTGLGGDL